MVPIKRVLPERGHQAGEKSCLIKVLKFYFGYYKKDENILPSNF